MRLPIFILGLCLVLCGILSYSFTSNIHSATLERTDTLPLNSVLAVNSQSISVTPENVSVDQSINSTLLNLNLTVVKESGELSSVIFKLAIHDNYQNCLNNQVGTCLVHREITNDTLRVPLHISSVYYFILDNTGSDQAKKVSVLASTVSVSITNTTSKDGIFNFSGLGLGILGAFISIIGIAKKTIIPWE